MKSDECQIRGKPKFVANLWTEFAAHRGEALATNGKELQNPYYSLVAATFEKANTYVFAGRLIRNAEARSSTLLCSTIYISGGILTSQ